MVENAPALVDVGPDVWSSWSGAPPYTSSKPAKLWSSPISIHPARTRATSHKLSWSPTRSCGETPTPLGRIKPNVRRSGRPRPNIPQTRHKLGRCNPHVVKRTPQSAKNAPTLVEANPSHTPQQHKSGRTEQTYGRNWSNQTAIDRAATCLGKQPANRPQIPQKMPEPPRSPIVLIYHYAVGPAQRARLGASGMPPTLAFAMSLRPACALSRQVRSTIGSSKQHGEASSSQGGSHHQFGRSFLWRDHGPSIPATAVGPCGTALCHTDTDHAQG